MTGWVLLDLDRTLVPDRTLERLARHFRREDAVAEALSLRGDEPNAGLEESRRVMAAFRGVDAAAFREVCGRVDLRPGAREAVAALRSRGFRVMVVTAGYEDAGLAVAGLVGADAVAALRPVVEDGRLTGDLLDSPWVGDCGRAVCKGRVAAALDRDGPLVAVGDGANDVCMFRAADAALAVAPCHPDAAEAAHACLLDLRGLPEAVDALLARGAARGMGMAPALPRGRC